MPNLLIVQHSPTPLLASLGESVCAGARDDLIEGVRVTIRPALEVAAEDFLAADGYVLGTPANFGYMSGALKHAFDSTYEHLRGRVDARPFSFWIHGRSDTTGARRSIESITTGLGWRAAVEPVELLGKPVDEAGHARLRELGGSMAALLMP